MGKDRVRWGLLGTARINTRIIEPIGQAARSELLAVASRTEEKAEDYARRWNIPRAHGNYQQLLADDDVDAIYVSLPKNVF